MKVQSSVDGLLLFVSLTALSAVVFSCAGIGTRKAPVVEEPAVTGPALPGVSVPGVEEEQKPPAEAETPPAEPVIEEPKPEVKALPKNYRFIPRDPSVTPAAPPPVHPGVGNVSSDAADPVFKLSKAEKSQLTVQFRLAFKAVALRGVPLTGALGGDRVHYWSPGKGARSAGAFSQNLRNPEGRTNSWGLKELVLAVRPFAGQRAFIVDGPLLDAYGRGEGLGGANGIAGYGAPIGEQYRTFSAVSQRFEYGLLSVGDDGKRSFLVEEAPGALSAAAGLASLVGRSDVSGSTGFPAEAGGEILASWLAAVNSGLPAAMPDAPVFLVEPKAGETVSVWIQVYGQGMWALVYPVDGKGALSRALLIAPPFLETFLGAASWNDAFSEYGIPLGDPYFRGTVLVQQFTNGNFESLDAEN